MLGEVAVGMLIMSPHLRCNRAGFGWWHATHPSARLLAGTSVTAELVPWPPWLCLAWMSRLVLRIAQAVTTVAIHREANPTPAGYVSHGGSIGFSKQQKQSITWVQLAEVAKESLGFSQGTLRPGSVRANDSHICVYERNTQTTMHRLAPITHCN